MAKQKKYKGTANPQYARDMAELRRSGAAGTHQDKRIKRARTRNAAKRTALKDQGGFFVVPVHVIPGFDSARGMR